MIDPNQVQQIIKQDVPMLTACGGIFTYCSLANTAEVMQQVGVISAGLGAIVLLVHRLIIFWRDYRGKPDD